MRSRKMVRNHVLTISSSSTIRITGGCLSFAIRFPFCLLNDRQDNGESRAATGSALHFDSTVVVLDDLLTDGQTKSRAKTRFLRGETRIEDSSLGFRRHTATGIGYRYTQRVVLFPGFDSNLTGSVDRLSRIHQDIHEDLIELIRETFDLADLPKFFHQTNAVLDLVMQQRKRALETFMHVGFLPD